MFPYRRLLHLLDTHVMNTDTTFTTPADSALTQITAGTFTEAHFLHYKERFLDWLVAAAIDIVAALLIFIIGRFVISVVIKALRAFMLKRRIEASLTTFIISMINVLLIILLVVSVVNRLGIETTSFAALLASIGLAVGMAFSGNLQNFASGVIVLLMRPYKVGDVINASLNTPVVGTVQEIQIFHTIIKTYDGNLIFVPNNMMMNNAIVNTTKIDSRLIELPIGIDYGQAIAPVEKLLLIIAQENEDVLQDPEPMVIVKQLADSAVIVELRCHVLNANFFTASNDLRRAIYERFTAAGINFPYPQITVHQA